MQIEDMLAKVKTRQGIAPDNTASDAVIRLMLSDAMDAAKAYCNRSVLPDALEHVIREVVSQTIDADNADHVASIKRGDTQISYQSVISADNYTARQQAALNRYRRIRIG